MEAANTAAPLVQGALEVAMALWRMRHQKASIQGRENPFLLADCEFVSKCLYKRHEFKVNKSLFLFLDLTIPHTSVRSSSSTHVESCSENRRETELDCQN
jgi:hypothetical protein